LRAESRQLGLARLSGTGSVRVWTRAVGGRVSPCAVIPLWCAVSPLVVFPPAVCGGCAPLRSFDPFRSILHHGSNWQLAGLRALLSQTWAGRQAADAGAPQQHALAPLRPRPPRRWPTRRPAIIMVAPRSSQPAQRRADFQRQRNTTRTPRRPRRRPRLTRTPSLARPTRFRSRWPRS